jgi:hypothetical protein
MKCALSIALITLACAGVVSPCTDQEADSSSVTSSLPQVVCDEPCPASYRKDYTYTCQSDPGSETDCVPDPHVLIREDDTFICIEGECVPINIKNYGPGYKTVLCP